MSEIIHDVNGGKLRLSKTRLTEVTGEFVPGLLWQWRFSNRPQKGFDGLNVKIKRFLPNLNDYAIVKYVPREHRIGCRRFSPEVWAKIMKAAKAVWRKHDR